jgi:hypothetical protein
LDGADGWTDELFMAYHYALYLERVASAGKQAYLIPMYTNVWQNYNDDDADNSFLVVVGGGDDPGDFSSVDGVINVLDVWKAFAPSLDIVSPDVYLNDYSSSCAKYRHREQSSLSSSRSSAAMSTVQDVCGLLSEAISVLVSLHSVSKLSSRTTIPPRHITGS